MVYVPGLVFLRGHPGVGVRKSLKVITVGGGGRRGQRERVYVEEVDPVENCLNRFSLFWF